MSDHLWSNVAHAIQALTSWMRGRTTSHSSLADTGAAWFGALERRAGVASRPPRQLSQSGDNLSKCAETAPTRADTGPKDADTAPKRTDIVPKGADSAPKGTEAVRKGADTPPRVTDIHQLGWERRYRVTDIAILGADTVFHVTGGPLKATDHGAHRALCRAFALDRVRSSTPRTAARRSRTSAPCSSTRARWCRAAATPWRDCRGSS